MADRTSMAKTNPVFKTAIGATGMIAAGGDEVAVAYIKAMSIDYPFPIPLKTGQEAMEFAGSKHLVLEKALVVGYRYQTMNRHVLASGCKNNLDLACGYTPRATFMAAHGINYVGGDLPIVVDTMSKLSAPYLADAKTTATYRAVDVTNPALMREAASLLDGEVCITMEGLVGYLQDHEKRLLFEGVRDVLAEHGGCCMLMDFNQDKLDVAAARALGTSEEEAVGVTRAGAAELSDTANMSLSFADAAGMQAFLAECGLASEVVTFDAPDAEVPAERLMSDEQRATFREAAQAIQMVVVRADASATAAAAPASATATMESGKGSSSLSLSADGTLGVELHGRIDTVSAPDLLKAYEDIAANGNVMSIDIDAADLDYISSAGLRVLMVMLKAVGVGNLHIHHTNETVRKILATTGFSDMVE